MNRRLVIAAMFLVLALLCLLLVGMSSARLAGGMTAQRTAYVTQAPASHVALELMSGEFADRHLA